MTARPATIVEALKDFHLDVRPYPFDTRPWFDFTTAGGWDPQGVAHHHTTGGSGLLVPGMNDSKRAILRLLRNGRPDLDGPLCHLAPAFMERGKRTVYLIGYGNVNHAGKGGVNVATAIRAGTYAGARPTTDVVDGNVMLYGLEYLHPGTSAPWPDELLDAGHMAAAALCQAEGWSRDHWAGSNCEHREWTTRKVDRSWSGWGDGMRERIDVLSKPAPPKPTPMVRARVRTVMSPSRFDRTPASLLVALKMYVQRNNLVLLTEVQNNKRAAVMRLLPGIGVVNIEPGTRSECAILFKQWRWRLQDAHAFRLTEDQPPSPLGANLPFGVGALLEWRKTGQTHAVLLAHLPRSVEGEDGFATDAAGRHNVPIWKDMVREEARLAKKWRADPEIDHVSVWNDWNVDWRQKWVRDYLQARFPGMTCNWEGHVPNTGGTHGPRRIIDFGFSDLDWVSSVLLPDDRSSDHRPSRAVALMRAVVRKVVRRGKIAP